MSRISRVAIRTGNPVRIAPTRTDTVRGPELDGDRMRLLLTGGTGLLGGALVNLLLTEGHEVRCLVREESPNASRLDKGGVEIVRGNADNARDLARSLSGMEAVLHVAGIEYSPQLVEATRQAGVGRVVVVGSTSAHSSYEFRSGPRLRMEKLVRESGLAYTIVRPSMIYGSDLERTRATCYDSLTLAVYPVFDPGEASLSAGLALPQTTRSLDDAYRPGSVVVVITAEAAGSALIAPPEASPVVHARARGWG